ncbi:MAG: integrin alpha [Solirubrobacteraceae bacterium]
MAGPGRIAVPPLLAAGVALLLGWPSAAQEPGGPLPHLRILGAAAEDGAGWSVANAGDVNGDGHADLVIGATGADGPNGRDAGAAYVVFGQPGTGTIDLAALGDRGFRIDGARPRDGAGWSVAGAGDLNRDGLADVIVGAPGPFEDSTNRRGSAYVVYGKRDSAAVDLRTSTNGFRIRGRRHLWPDRFGSTVAGVGDVNGDGRPDVAVGAIGNPGFEEQFTRGSAVVVYGRRRGARLRIRGGVVEAVAGLGDVDGDGRDDVGIADSGFYGAAFVVYGRAGGRTLSLDRLRRRDGFAIRRNRYDLGTTIAGAGDFDRDGLADVLVGKQRGLHGGAWVVFGRRNRRAVDLRQPSRAALEVVHAGEGSVGWAVAGAGRVDPGRRADVLVATVRSVVIVLGKRSRRPVPAEPGRHTIVLDGGDYEGPGGFWPNPYGGVGPGDVANAGDWDGDGRDDVAVGAPAVPGAGRDLAGAVTVITGAG